MSTWVITLFVTLGIAGVGGIWVLIIAVIKVTRMIVTMHNKIDDMAPNVQQIPEIRQTVAVHEYRLNAHSERFNQLQGS